MKYHHELQQAEYSYQAGHSLLDSGSLSTDLINADGTTRWGGEGETGYISASTWTVKLCFISGFKLQQSSMQRGFTIVLQANTADTCKREIPVSSFN